MAAGGAGAETIYCGDGAGRRDGGSDSDDRGRRYPHREGGTDTILYLRGECSDSGTELDCQDDSARRAAIPRSDLSATGLGRAPTTSSSRATVGSPPGSKPFGIQVTLTATSTTTPDAGTPDAGASDGGRRTPASTAASERHDGLTAHAAAIKRSIAAVSRPGRPRSFRSRERAKRGVRPQGAPEVGSRAKRAGRFEPLVQRPSLPTTRVVAASAFDRSYQADSKLAPRPAQPVRFGCGGLRAGGASWALSRSDSSAA